MARKKIASVGSSGRSSGVDGSRRISQDFEYRVPRTMHDRDDTPLEIDAPILSRSERSRRALPKSASGEFDPDAAVPRESKAWLTQVRRWRRSSITSTKRTLFSTQWQFREGRRRSRSRVRQRQIETTDRQTGAGPVEESTASTKNILQPAATYGFFPAASRRQRQFSIFDADHRTAVAASSTFPRQDLRRRPLPWPTTSIPRSNGARGRLRRR